MPVPTGFYSEFRCKTSMMAAGTGLMMGYLATIFVPPFFHPCIQFAPILLGCVIAVIISQYVVHNYLYGKMRGAFEYVYRDSLINSTTEHTYKEIMILAEKGEDDERFTHYLAAAHAANVDSEFSKEVEALKKAAMIRPKDLIANFRLARAFEKIGSAEGAINSYEACLSDPSIDSQELRQFFISQAIRVKKNGPQQASPIPGLIYQLM